jgi:cell division protein FtsB
VLRAVTREPSRWRRWRHRLALASLLALALAYLPYRLIDSAGERKANRLSAELDRVRAKSASLAETNAALRRDIEALRNDPHAIVDIARDELGLVRPGELVIRIENQRPRAADREVE